MFMSLMRKDCSKILGYVVKRKESHSGFVPARAFCLFCSSLRSLCAGGFVLWGWASMTGDNVFQLSWNGKAWTREDMIPLKDPKNKRSCAFRTTKERFNNEKIWKLLKKYDDQKALISASIGKKAGRKTDGPAGEQMLEREGLVAGHAYSVIAAMEVSERLPGGVAPKPGGKTFRLLHIRNPWGKFEWKGKWSDHSNLWKKYKSIANQLGVKPNKAADDGAFWMQYEDFKRVYTRINICDRDTKTDASLEINEDIAVCGMVQGFCVGCGKFWCLCHGFRNLYLSHETTHKTVNTKDKCCWIC